MEKIQQQEKTISNTELYKLMSVKAKVFLRSGDTSTELVGTIKGITEISGVTYALMETGTLNTEMIDVKNIGSVTLKIKNKEDELEDQIFWQK